MTRAHIKTAGGTRRAYLAALLVCAATWMSVGFGSRGVTEDGPRVRALDPRGVPPALAGNARLRPAPARSTEAKVAGGATRAEIIGPGSLRRVITVRDADGVPCAGCAVWVTVAEDGIAGRPFASAVTDDAGRAELVGLVETRALRISVAPPEGAVRWARISETPWSLDDAQLTIPAGCTVEGRVVDADGRPFARAVVRITRPGEQRSLGIATNDEGRFQIAQLAAGPVLLAAETEDGTSPVVIVDVSSAKNDPVTLVVERRASLDVSIRGVPSGVVARAFLTVAGPVAEAEPAQQRIASPTGQVSFTGLDAASTYSVWVLADDLSGCAWVEQVTVRESPLMLDWTLGSSVTGRVSADASAESIAITLSGPGFRLSGHPRADGTFDLHPVPDGMWSLTVRDTMAPNTPAVAISVIAGRSYDVVIRR